MKVKTFTLSFLRCLCAVLFLIGISLSAKALPIKSLTLTEAQAITFEWIDADGLSHTNSIADKATDPRHIVALLKTIYTNPAVPGNYYRAYNSSFKAVKDSQNKNAVDMAYGAVTSGSKGGGWGIMSAQKPNEEGYTVLLVSVKQGFSGTSKKFSEQTDTEAALISYIEKSIASVELLTNFRRYGSEEDHTCGTVFSISGQYNTFFFLSKGKCLSTSLTPDYPFGTMFEEFSPYDTSTHTSKSDFYAALIAGEAETIEHDCSSVLETNHTFNLSGSSGEDQLFDMTGVQFFIPDYRMTYWRKYSGGKYSGRDYGATGTANTVYHKYNPTYSPTVSMYAVRLSAVAERLGAAEDHKYTVTLNWTTTAAEGEAQTFQVYRVVNGVVEDTPVASLNDTFTWSETVDELTGGYTLTYVVRGRPTEDESIPFVTSNKASVVIPGYDDLERLVIEIGDNCESTYTYAAETNQYANFIVVNNSNEAPVTSSDLAEGSKLQLYRGTSSEAQPDVLVATVTVSSLTSTKVNYTVVYSNQADATESKYPSKSGSFTIGTGAVVDFADFTLCDQFNASTADNAHPDAYYYQLRFLSQKTYETPEGTSSSDVRSNTADVQIYKSDYTLSGGHYTAAQVDADTDLQNLLPLTESVTMTLSAYDDRNVINYFMVKDGTNNGKAGIYAQNTNDGNYAVHDLESQTTVCPAERVVMQEDISDPSVDVTALRYVPIIDTYRADGSADHNTYGADIKTPATISFEATLNGAERSKDTFEVSGVTGRYYQAAIDIVASIPESLEPVSVRVWKTCDTPLEEDGKNQERLNQSAPLYEGDAQESFTIPSASLEFGAIDGTVETEYTIRLYAREKSPSAKSSIALKASTPEAKYFIAEQTLSFTFDDSVVTGIDQLPVSADTSDKVYDLQGRRVLRPGRGIYIVNGRKVIF